VGGWSGKTRNRLIFLYWLFTFFYVCLVARLAHLQWLKNERFASLARAQQEGDIEVPALRGDIRDRNGVVLASSLSLSSVAVNPKEVKDAGGATKRLASLLGQSEASVHSAITGPGTFQWLARKVPDKIAGALKKDPVPGVFLLREPTSGRRFYPKGRLAAHLLGATGIDEQGLDGIEASYDEYLGGSPGVLRTLMDRDGWMIPVATQRLIKKAVPGRHLVLTLDETIQHVAERELAAAVKLRQARGGICVVLDVKTGGLLALGIMPDFAAENFAQAAPALRRNRALTDPYEPGSTFKMFLAASAIDSGISMTQMFTAGGVITVGGWPIHNDRDDECPAGVADIREIVQYSYNVGTSSVALHIGKNKFAKYLHEFGFGQQTGIDLTGEGEGILAPVKEWADINTCTISFGQGVAVTPMQLVSGLQAIANGGVRLKPHVVQEVLNPDGSLYKKIRPQEVSRPISADSAKKVLECLELVVKDGTGRKAAVPGYRVAGKTGTAQVSDGGVYASGRYIGSFLGVAPVEDPRVVCLVKIEEPGTAIYGGVVAAPVFSRVVQEAMWKLGVSPSHPEEISNAAQGGQNGE
jgi:stage V sporulation protein D (sporulation-specific penicillin-binding protein)